MKFLDVQKHTGELDENIKALQSYEDVLEATEARITLVVNREDVFKGEGAHGIMNYHQHMILPAIRSLRVGIDSFKDTLEKVKALISDYEPEANGSVAEEFWKTSLPNSYNNYEESIEQSEKNVNKILDSISDILCINKLQTEDVKTNVQNARDHADTVLEGLFELDQAGVELMAAVRTKMEELEATVNQVINWTLTGGVQMTGVSIMEVGGYFANSATLHKGASAVDTSKVSTGAVEPGLVDNPSLAQHAANFFNQVSTLDNVYTVADAAMKATNYVYQAGMRLDKRFGSPVSNGILNASMRGQYYLQTGVLKSKNAIMTKMNPYLNNIMADPRVVYGNYRVNQMMNGMRSFGNASMTTLSNVNQFYQGKKASVRAGINGKATALINTSAGQSVMTTLNNVASNKYVAVAGKGLKTVGKAMGPLGMGISIADNMAEFWREENSGKTGWEKAGRAAGGMALDFGPAVIGLTAGAMFGPAGALIGGTAGLAISAGIAAWNLFTEGSLTNKARDLGETAMRKVGETFDTAVDTVVDAGKKVLDTGKAVVDTVGNAIETGKKAVETVGKAADAVTGLFSGIGDFMAGNAR
ncbi:T7SS effector LXG polymorphic toxin [Bacillus sp. FSL W7-1360]